MIRLLRTHRASWGLLVPIVVRCATGATMSAVRRMDDALLPLDDDLDDAVSAPLRPAA